MAASWQLRARVLCRRFIAAPSPSPPLRPPCAPIETPILGSHLFYDDESTEGSMELMAVPKKRVSIHKRRLRNAPKRLRPIPLIAQCPHCGRYKLPMYFCCKPKDEQYLPNNGNFPN